MSRQIPALVVAVVAAGIGFAAGVLYAGQPAPVWFPRYYSSYNVEFWPEFLREASGGRPFATEQACLTWVSKVMDVDDLEDKDDIRCEKGGSR